MSSDNIERRPEHSPKVDRLIIGGAMAYTFFKVARRSGGKSWAKTPSRLSKKIEAAAKKRGVALLPAGRTTWSRRKAGRRCRARDSSGRRRANR